MPDEPERLISPADKEHVSNQIVHCTLCGKVKLPGSPDLQPSAATQQHPFHIHDWAVVE